MPTLSTIISQGPIFEHDNVFDAFERVFAHCAAGNIVLLEPDDFTPALSAETITVRAAREILSDRQSPKDLCDAIWTIVIRQTRRQTDPWEMIALWLMLPSLRAISNRLFRTWHGDIDDMRSNVLLGFLEMLHQADPDRPHMGGYLWWRTFGMARKACWQASREQPTEDVEFTAALQATSDRATTVPIAALPPDALVSAPCASEATEGERLGALACRLGIRDILDTRGNGTGAAA